MAQIAPTVSFTLKSETRGLEQISLRQVHYKLYLRYLHRCKETCYLHFVKTSYRKPQSRGPGSWTKDWREYLSILIGESHHKLQSLGENRQRLRQTIKSTIEASHYDKLYQAIEQRRKTDPIGDWTETRAKLNEITKKWVMSPEEDCRTTRYRYGVKDWILLSHHTPYPRTIHSLLLKRQYATCLEKNRTQL